MEKDYNEIDVLIAKVLSDEATTSEKSTLQNWLSASAENKIQFEQMRQIWAISDDALSLEGVDTEGAWQKVRSRTVARKPLSINWLSNRNILRAAAAAAILIVASVFFLQKETPLDIIQSVQIVASEKIKIDTLTDGSVTTLNKKSALTTVFSKKERRVRLAGEAFFDVTPDREKPFVVEVKNLEVVVVGTAFNVDETSETGKIVVTVEEGKVLVRSKLDSLYLIPGEKATFDVKTGLFDDVKKNENKNVIAYKTGKYDLDGMSLVDAIALLSLYYGVSVEINSAKAKECRVSGKQSFNQPLEDVLNLLIAPCELSLGEKNGGFIVQ